MLIAVLVLLLFALNGAVASKTIHVVIFAQYFCSVNHSIIHTCSHQRQWQPVLSCCICAQRGPIGRQYKGKCILGFWLHYADVFESLGLENIGMKLKSKLIQVMLQPFGTLANYRRLLWIPFIWIEAAHTIIICLMWCDRHDCLHSCWVAVSRGWRPQIVRSESSQTFGMNAAVLEQSVSAGLSRDNAPAARLIAEFLSLRNNCSFNLWLI